MGVYHHILYDFGSTSRNFLISYGGMDRVRLFIATMSLWILFTTAPSFNEVLPLFSLQSEKETVTIPLAQALNQLVGAVISILSFALLQSVLNGKQSWIANASLLFFGYFVNAGHGIHAACVVSERLPTQGHQVFNLLHALHVQVSHNMFMGGYFGMLMVIMCAEIVTSLKYQQLKEKVEVEQPRGLLQWLFQWVVPLPVGIYFSVFATRTATVLVTKVFYLTIALMYMVVYNKMSSLGLSASDIYLFITTHMTIFHNIVKSVCIGTICLLFIY